MVPYGTLTIQRTQFPINKNNENMHIFVYFCIKSCSVQHERWHPGERRRVSNRFKSNVFEAHIDPPSKNKNNIIYIYISTFGSMNFCNHVRWGENALWFQKHPVANVILGGCIWMHDHYSVLSFKSSPDDLWTEPWQSHTKYIKQRKQHSTLVGSPNEMNVEKLYLIENPPAVALSPVTCIWGNTWFGA